MLRLIKKMDLLFSAFIFVFGLSRAEALVLTFDSTGLLNGAIGVSIDGVLYDVEFVDNHAYAIFWDNTNGYTFTFSTAREAEAASQALLEQVLVSDYDTDPSLVLDGKKAGYTYSFNVINTPYGYYTTQSGSDTQYSIQYVSASNYEEESGDGTASDTLWSIYNPAHYVYAVWTLSAVPVPSTMFLLGSGIIGLTGIARRKK